MEPRGTLSGDDLGSGRDLWLMPSSEGFLRVSCQVAPKSSLDAEGSQSHVRVEGLLQCHYSFVGQQVDGLHLQNLLKSEIKA